MGKPAPENLPDDASALHAAAIGKARILLVEDNPRDVRLLRAYLAESPDHNLTLEVAETLTAALERLDRGGIDAILLDLSLPESTGVETFRRVHHHSPKVPLVVLTGLRDEELALRTLHEGAQDFLDKAHLDGYTLRRMLRYAMERQSLREQLAQQAFQDPLTTLANRALFLDRLRHSLDRMKRAPHGLGLMFLDLDRFKYVNDAFGHPAGDELLRGLADRLRESVRQGDTLARFGGDEFAVLLYDVSSPATLKRLARRLLHNLEDPFDVQGREVTISASIGLVLCTESGATAEELLRQADIALYQAKSAGKARAVLYEPEMGREAVRRLALETDLSHALERNQFRLHYQPEVDLKSGEIVGVEALLRWQHPRRGLVGAGEFMNVAEVLGIAPAIGRWVRDQACRQVSDWNAARPDRPPLLLSVNVSAGEFLQPFFVPEVEMVLRRTGLPADRLRLEITEGLVLEDLDQALRRLHAFRQLQVKVALDDFGTGYSSLGYLRRLPIDTIKVDRLFVWELDEDETSRIILRAISELAAALRMQVTAEGVETEAQHRRLLEAGCRHGQGYHYFRPVDPRTLTRLLGIRHSR